MGIYGKVLNEDTKPEKKEVTITITGYPRAVTKLCNMLGYIEWLAQVGHSTSFEVHVDGDGCVGFSLKQDGKPILKPNNGNIETIKSMKNNDGDIKDFYFD